MVKNLIRIWTSVCKHSEGQLLKPREVSCRLFYTETMFKNKARNVLGNGGANSHILLSGNVKYTTNLFLSKLMYTCSNEHINTSG